MSDINGTNTPADAAAARTESETLAFIEQNLVEAVTLTKAQEARLNAQADEIKTLVGRVEQSDRRWAEYDIAILDNMRPPVAQ
jgi:hypothetical protein